MSVPSRLEPFLRAVHGAPTINLLEIRFRRSAGGMGQCFFEGHRLRDAAQLITELGTQTDVYFGVAPRRTPVGGRNGILTASCLWADCDDERSVMALDRARVPPSIIVASGSAAGRHAYWLLAEPLGIEVVEQLNRRLALALGADGRCADAARILRPPETQNFKYQPPGPVVLEQFVPERRYRREELDVWLPQQPAPEPEQWTHSERQFSSDPLRAIPPATYARVLLGVSVDRSRKIRCPFHDLSAGEATAEGGSPARSVDDASSTEHCDRLLLVPPPVYFERLTGLRVGRSGKLHCLFHDDRTPSLHVYREPERGWYCFGCQRGGSVYDLGALLLGRRARGRDFLELRRELEELLLPSPPQRPRGT